MRFILNFIFYGILFFLIWRYFPDGFEKLVSWATAFWDFVVALAVNIADKVKGSTAGGEAAAPAKAYLIPFLLSALTKKD